MHLCYEKCNGVTYLSLLASLPGLKQELDLSVAEAGGKHASAWSDW